MKLSEHKDLKKEIIALPEKEKDKLLLRLVAKDKILTEHLHFLLLEDQSNLEDRVEDVKAEIVAAIEMLTLTPKANARDTLLVLRKLIKQINHFYKVTKASVEEIELKLLLFNLAPIVYKFKVYSAVKNHEDLLANYTVKAVLVLLRKLDKLHEDLKFDLKEEVNRLLTKIHTSYMTKTALTLNLPKQMD